MKFYEIIITCLFFGGCALQNPSLYNSNSYHFKSKYKDAIGSKEQIISSWYHYVSTKDSSGNYILRTFIPETRQITSEVRFINEKLTIKGGPSIFWHENGNLKSIGNYKNNKAEGQWVYYHRKTGKLSSFGLYKSDLKESDWKFYDEKERLESVITYNGDLKDGKFTEFDSLQNIVNTGIYKSDTIFQQTKIDTSSQLELGVHDHLPYLSQCKSIEQWIEREKCSKKSLLKYIYKNMKYPKLARKYKIEGLTVTQIVIDEDGQVTDIDVIIGLCQEFKNEIERVFSNMPSWEPGTQLGKKAKVSYIIPVNFKLNK